MNKKGFEMLGEFGVKLILAILCIIILLGLACYISHLFMEDSREKQAKATADDILSQVEVLKNSQLTELDYSYRSPSGWFLHTTTFVNEVYFCVCPTKSFESCVKQTCSELKNTILIDESLKDYSLASDRAETIIIKKGENNFRLIKK